MYKESKLSKIMNSFKKNLIFPLAGVFLFSGCYTSFNVPSKKEHRRDLHQTLENVRVWDYDGDGIMNDFDLWPYRYGPYVDMNHNGYVDWGDLKINGYFYISGPFWYSYRTYFPPYYKKYIFKPYKQKGKILKSGKRNNIKLRNNFGIRNTPSKREAQKRKVRKRAQRNSKVRKR